MMKNYFEFIKYLAVSLSLYGMFFDYRLLKLAGAGFFMSLSIMFLREAWDDYRREKLIRWCDN